MKMKKIAAVLTALSVLSGCAGNTVTEETVTTTGTITEVVTVETTTTTTTTEVVTEATERTKEPTSDTVLWATTSETSVPEEEIIPLELETFSHSEYLENNSRLTENTVISVLMNTLGYKDNLGNPLRSDSMLFIRYDNKSSLDAPLPSSTMVSRWGYYPSVVSMMFEDERLFNVFGDYSCNNMTGCKPDEMYAKVDEGTPVMVYSTYKLFEPTVLKEYEGEILWNPIECVILVGYSENSVMVWSPLEDDFVIYNRADFEAVFEKMGSMALTVVKE